MSTTETIRPWEAACITGRGSPAGSSTLQLYWAWLSAVKIASTNGVARVAMVRTGPSARSHELGPPTVGSSPRCSSTTIAWTPRKSSVAAVRSMVASSSPNSSPATPSTATFDGVSEGITPITTRGRDAVDVVHHERQRRGGAVGEGHVRREDGELRAGELGFELAAVDGVAAAGLHPPELAEALVEFVGADRGGVHAHRVEQVDGRVHRETVADSMGEDPQLSPTE